MDNIGLLRLIELALPNEQRCSIDWARPVSSARTFPSIQGVRAERFSGIWQMAFVQYP
jgi:hypothetical protein